METGPYLRLLLWKAHKAAEAVDRGSIAITGLGLSDFAVLEALMHKGPMPVGLIGKKVLLTSGSISSAIDRLERQALVQRRQDPHDGRIFHVHLTDKGRHVIRHAYTAHAQRLEQIASVLSPQERHELARLLKKIGFQAADVAKTVGD
jgi:MarR family 2-MHQ and catechol resistance regulon transcriptional repressor